LNPLISLYRLVKPLLPRSIQRAVSNFAAWLRMCLPRRFELVVYRAESVPEPDLSGLEIEAVEFSKPLTEEQRAFILRDLSEPALRDNLRRFHDGWECVYMTRTEGRYCSYMFCKSLKRYRRVIRILDIPGACLIGPGYTAPEFRGRNIHARAMQYAMRDAARRGFGPFFGFVYPWNKAAISAMAKAGWQRIGVWRGVTALRWRLAWARRVSD